MSTIAEFNVVRVRLTGALVARGLVPDAPGLPRVVFLPVDSEAEAPAALAALVARYDREGWPPDAPGGDDARDARAAACRNSLFGWWHTARAEAWNDAEGPVPDAGPDPSPTSGTAPSGGGSRSA